MGHLRLFDNAYKFLVAQSFLSKHTGDIINANSNYVGAGNNLPQSKQLYVKTTDGLNKYLLGFQNSLSYGIFERTVQIFGSSESESSFTHDKYSVVTNSSNSYTAVLNYNDSKFTKTYTIQLTNNTDNSITVNSLVGIINVYLSDNGAYSTSSNIYNVLLWAYYLDDSITVQPNTTEVITFKVSLPMTEPTI